MTSKPRVGCYATLAKGDRRWASASRASSLASVAPFGSGPRPTFPQRRTEALQLETLPTV